MTLRYALCTLSAPPLRSMSCVIVRVRVVFGKTVVVVGDRRFDYQSGSHPLPKSQVKSLRQMMVFMPQVVSLIGQFCRDV